MIISKKKFNEKITEALERADHERWILDRIATIERECNERIEALHRYLHDLEMKLDKRDNDGT